MGNPKAALESKAAAVVVLIRPTGGWGVTPPPQDINFQLYQLSPTPDHVSYPLIPTSGLGGKCIPKSALGPKASAAPSVSAELSAKSHPAPRMISALSSSDQAQPLHIRM